MDRGALHAIRTIGGAIETLYDLDSEYRPEDFLISKPPETGVAVHNAEFQGALFIRGQERDFSVGIYLSEPVLNQLTSFPLWASTCWSKDQMGAFSVATEEVSHFHYLLHHAAYDRPISQLELELQGDIDKFLLAFFANCGEGVDAEATFDGLFEQLFYRFRLAEHLTPEQYARYQDANAFARRFIRKHARELLTNSRRRDRALRLLRRFYRLDVCEKMSLIAGE